MEVEVKLRLLSKEGHDKVVELLKEGQQNHFRQENYFFDGPSQELSSQRMVLRCRFYNDTEKACVTLKGKMKVEDGIGRATEDEDWVDPVKSREFLTNPSALLDADIAVIRKLRSNIDVQSLKCLGRFKNVRKEIKWEGNLLEVDETQYDWGTVYEIECETSEPEAVRNKLEEFLKANSIAYKFNTSTKFHNFINKTLE